MKRFALGFAIASVVLSLGLVATAVVLSSQISDLQARLDDQRAAARATLGRIADLEMSVSGTEVAVSDFESEMSLVQTQLAGVRKCLPDLQLEVELLDVRGASGTFAQFETVAAQVSPPCRRVLDVLFIGAD